MTGAAADLRDRRRLTGAMAAQTLREEGYTGRIVSIGDEVERPYERLSLAMSSARRGGSRIR